METVLMFCGAIWVVFGLISNTKSGMNLNGWVNIW